jgi:hypothetical protein
MRGPVITGAALAAGLGTGAVSITGAVTGTGTGGFFGILTFLTRVRILPPFESATLGVAVVTGAGGSDRGFVGLDRFRFLC